MFTASSLEHLAERNFDEVDVANAVFGEYGAVFVRRIGRGKDLRWLIIAPLEDEELLSCVLRVTEPRDLEAEGAFVIPATGIPEEPTVFASSMRLCVSARKSEPDEIRSYRDWRSRKGG